MIVVDTNTIAYLYIQGQRTAQLYFYTTSKCSSYDCEFVGLAKSLQVPLITSDKELLMNFPSVAISMEKFVT